MEREIQDLPVDFDAQQKAMAEVLKARLSESSAPKLTVTQAKKFRLPSGEESDGPIDLIVVDFVYRNEYYEGAYVRNVYTPPVCFAINSDIKTMIPSVHSPSRQADTCEVCSQNQFGSTPTGGKACKNQRGLIVLPPDFDDSSPLWRLTVSPTGSGMFDRYVKNLLSTKKLLPQQVITQVGFDPKTDYPSLRFNFGSLISREALSDVFARAEEAREILLKEPDLTPQAVSSATGTKKR